MAYPVDGPDGFTYLHTWGRTFGISFWNKYPPLDDARAIPENGSFYFCGFGGLAGNFSFMGEYIQAQPINENYIDGFFVGRTITPTTSGPQPDPPYYIGDRMLVYVAAPPVVITADLFSASTDYRIYVPPPPSPTETEFYWYWIGIESVEGLVDHTV
jgi:hypothetical protein